MLARLEQNRKTIDVIFGKLSMNMVVFGLIPLKILIWGRL
jgi:hypothetical protein